MCCVSLEEIERRSETRSRVVVNKKCHLPATSSVATAHKPRQLPYFCYRRPYVGVASQQSLQRFHRRWAQVNSPGVKKGLKLAVDHKLKGRVTDSKFHGPRSPTGKQHEQHHSQRPHVDFERVKRGRCLGGIHNFGGPVERWPAPARPRVSCSNFHLMDKEK